MSAVGTSALSSPFRGLGIGLIAMLSLMVSCANTVTFRTENASAKPGNQLNQGGKPSASSEDPTQPPPTFPTAVAPARVAGASLTMDCLPGQDDSKLNGQGMLDCVITTSNIRLLPTHQDVLVEYVSTSGKTESLIFASVQKHKDELHVLIPLQIDLINEIDSIKVTLFNVPNENNGTSDQETVTTTVTTTVTKATKEAVTANDALPPIGQIITDMELPVEVPTPTPTPAPTPTPTAAPTITSGTKIMNLVDNGLSITCNNKQGQATLQLLTTNFTQGAGAKIDFMLAVSGCEGELTSFQISGVKFDHDVANNGSDPVFAVKNTTTSTALVTAALGAICGQGDLFGGPQNFHHFGNSGEFTFSSEASRFIISIDISGRRFTDSSPTGSYESTSTMLRFPVALKLGGNDIYTDFVTTNRL